MFPFVEFIRLWASARAMTLRLWCWWKSLTTRRRVLFIAIGWIAFCLINAAPALAGSPSSAPATMSWMDIKDSHGISIWTYRVSLNEGGITKPGRLIYSFMVLTVWEFYRVLCAFGIWMIDWTLSFSWVSFLSAPLIDLSDNLSQIFGRFGVGPLFLTVTAVVAVFIMMRGKWALGIFEIIMACVVASLALGALSSPIRVVAGPDGLLFQARDTGLAVASGLANDGDTSGSPDEFRKSISASMTDTFVRQPTQLLNFGEVVDGTKCEKKWNEAIKDDSPRDRMGDCKDKLNDVADEPNASMVIAGVMLIPAAVIILTFAVIMAGTVLLAAFTTMFRGVKLLWDLIIGTLPGNARGPMWMSVSEVIIGLVTVIFSVIFLAAYVLLVQATFNTDDDVVQIKTFFIVDIILAVGLVVYWRARGQLKNAAERIASSLSKRPQGGPSSLPQRQGNSASDLYYKTRLASSAASTAAGALGGAARTGGKPVAATYRSGRKAGHAVADQLTKPRWFGSYKVGDPDPSGTAADRVQARVEDSKPQQNRQLAGKVVKVASGTAQLAAAAATGGTSAVASTAARTVTSGIVNSRRQAIVSKLTPRQIPPSSGVVQGEVVHGSTRLTPAAAASENARPMPGPGRTLSPGTVVAMPKVTTSTEPPASSQEGVAERLAARLAAHRQGNALPGRRRE